MTRVAHIRRWVHRVARLSLAVLCVAVLLIAGFCGFSRLRDDSIIRVSTSVLNMSDIDLDHRRFYVLGDHAVLYTDRFGKSKIVDTVSHRAQFVPALDVTTNNMRIWHGETRLSPDGKYFLCVDDANEVATVCKVDGTVVERSRIHNYLRTAWCPDSRHWLLFCDDGLGGGVTTVFRFDALAPRPSGGQVVAIPKVFTTARTAIDRSGMHAFIVPNPLTRLGEVAITKQNWDSGAKIEESRLLMSAFGDAPISLEGKFSPGGNFILWIALMPRPAYAPYMIQSSLPYIIRDRSTSRVELWLSDGSGGRLRYVGHFPVDKGLAAWPAEIEWKANETSLDYVYNSCLYSLSVR